MILMWALVAGFLLDLRFGDPVYSFHPVRLMGQGISQAEHLLRRAVKSEKLAGAILAFSIPAVVFCLSAGFLFLLGKIHFWLAWSASIFGIYSAISIRDMKTEALRVYRHLVKNDLEKTRRDLARIVGRDTAHLDEMESIRACVETVAESTVDGIVAPLFYAALGGVPLALAYKAVNTLDSMIGHTNERYRLFGYAAAKQDAFWNWLPARISYLTIAVGALFFNARFSEALFAGWQDGVSEASAVSAIPEATFAGALGLRLGGASSYAGEIVQKPYLGFAVKDLDRDDIIRSVRLMKHTAWVTLVLLLPLSWLAEVWYGPYLFWNL